MVYELVYTYHDLLYYQVMQCSPISYKYYVTTKEVQAIIVSGNWKTRKHERTPGSQDWTAHHSVIVYC